MKSPSVEIVPPVAVQLTVAGPVVPSSYRSVATNWCVPPAGSVTASGAIATVACGRPSLEEPAPHANAMEKKTPADNVLMGRQGNRTAASELEGKGPHV